MDARVFLCWLVPRFAAPALPRPRPTPSPACGRGTAGGGRLCGASLNALALVLDFCQERNHVIACLLLGAASTAVPLYDMGQVSDGPLREM